MEMKALSLIAAVGAGILLGAGITYVVVSRDAEPGISAAAPTDLWNNAHRPGQVANGTGQVANGDLDAKIAELRQRLDTNPSSLGDWIEIGRRYREAGRYQEAASAFRRTWEIAGDQPIVLSAYGEALVLAAGGAVTPEARTFLEAAVRANPGDIKAQHYLALAEEREDNKEQALNRWVDILRNAPAGATWAPAVRERIAENAKALGRDVTALLPEAKNSARDGQEAAVARGPSAADVAASANMAPQDRQAMIEGMVAKLAARLEESPNDLQGWMRLGKSYSVLRQFDKAEDAYSRAEKLAPDNPEVLSTYAHAVRAVANDKATPRYLEVMQRLLAVEPNNPEALWRLGEAAAVSGDTDKGIAMLEAALKNTPADSPDHVTIQKHIAAIRLGATTQLPTR